MKLSIVSGGFDPIHVGHIECFEKARALADDLFVIVNDDNFLVRKKGKAFMPEDERRTVIQAFESVTKAIKSVDLDDTVCKTLRQIYEEHKDKYEKIMFCNGGDRVFEADKPEHKMCIDLGMEPVYGLGDKIQSSSLLINPNPIDKSSPRPEGILLQELYRSRVLGNIQ
jgi:D-beta-D-heptose 7-phosphate kinase/D-beta-D-heptose 1-phosphate adenosyltransferase